MGMGLGEGIRVTIFGESHGKCVGALVEGMPPGTPIDTEALMRDLSNRKTGKRGLSPRLETDLDAPKVAFIIGIQYACSLSTSFAYV